jgi:hypothetical protein
LKHDSQPGKTLCMFTDFVLSENANHWRDGSGFLTTGELQAYWDFFIGARPQSKPKPSPQASTSAQAQQSGTGQGRTSRKRRSSLSWTSARNGTWVSATKLPVHATRSTVWL